MASQPIPAVGSVTFIIHLLIIGISKFLKIPLALWLIPIIALITVVLGNRFLPHNNYNVVATSPSVQHKHTNEQTIPITNTDFLKQMHFYAWAPWWDEQRVMNSLSQTKGSLEQISPIWYKLSEQGELTENPSKLKDQITQTVSSSGILIMPTINNENDTGFDEKRVAEFLQSSTLEKTFIQNAISIAQSNDYVGWDIDWEQKNSEDTQGFNNFIKTLAQELHQNNLQLAVTVRAKSQDITEENTNYGEDWKILQKYADEIRIMVYDFHYDGSDAGAITPLDDLESVLDYAGKTIPKNKIVIGVPMYGYDWTDKKGETVQYNDAVDRITNHNGSITRDPESQELIGNYTDVLTQHTEWFLDKKSILRILYIVNNYDITKVSFWRLGGEDPALWQLK